MLMVLPQNESFTRNRFALRVKWQRRRLLYEWCK
jgi:hypothetical protein